MKFPIGAGLKCDLTALIDTRGLIQANSGGGKSWILRRLLEQTHGHVQHILLDPEGEFSSLREKFDYVLAAKQGGDTAADPRAAKLLAHKLLDLKVSAIIDLYELHAHERIRFVRLFLEALVDAPKALWHPALIVLDEAHVFCPEKGQAESAGAVIDLATRGRKRGFCALLATQRIAKLHKDAAAELNNKLIGRTGQDIDIKRAADELGFSGREQSYQLRDLEPGEFFGFGPAISRSVIKVKVGPVETTHPKAGARRAFEAPRPTAAILALLPQLADLPAEAEQRQKTEADLRKELATARGEVTRLQKATPKVDLTDVIKARTKAGELEIHNERLTEALERLMKFIVEINAQDFFKAGGEQIDQAALQKVIDAAAQQAVKLVESNVKAQGAALERWRKQGERMLDEIRRLLKRDVKVAVAVRHNAPFTTTPSVSVPRPPRPQPPADGSFRPGGSQQRILNALRWLETVGVEEGDKSQVALLADQSPTSGGYFNNLGTLRTAGLIDYPRAGVLCLTDAGRTQADPGDVPETSEALHQTLFAKLGPSKSALLKALIEVYPKPLTKTELAENAAAHLGKAISATSGGYFNNLGTLRSLKLIDYPTPGSVVALPVLFLNGDR